MNVGVVGLGLIGGSFAKAYKAFGHTVYAHDTDASTLDYALLSGVVDAPLDNDVIGLCELVIIALYPGATIEYLESHAQFISSKTIVIDCCGIKRNICTAGFNAAARHGFTFVGGHPMAGTEYSGFKHSKANIFKGASMIIVPPIYNDIVFLEKLKQLLAPAEFGRLTITTADKHDEIIAYTSQLAHLVSGSIIKSPTAFAHKGFSAGSYKDMTRVARLNEQMWTELLMGNKEHILRELDFFMSSLHEYRNALQNNDIDSLRRLLGDGRRLKEEVDRL